MKNINPLGLFEDLFLTQKLGKLGNPLGKLDRYIDWKIFQDTANQAIESKEGKEKKGGRPAYDRLMLFKALIIQSLYNLSDEQLEYRILDRTSFKIFCDAEKKWTSACQQDLLAFQGAADIIGLDRIPFYRLQCPANNGLGKGGSKNRDDEHCIQYLPLCTTDKGD